MFRYSVTVTDRCGTEDKAYCRRVSYGRQNGSSVYRTEAAPERDVRIGPVNAAEKAATEKQYRKRGEKMRTDKNRKNRRFGRIAAAVLAVSSISAGIFGLVAEVSAQAGLNGAEKIPTSYHVPTALPVPEISGADTGGEAGREAADEGRNAADKGAAARTDSNTGAAVNYHVSMSCLNTEEPTSIDLTMEEAAAIGMKYLEDIMGFDQEGVNVYMSYNSGTETFPRAFWDGDVRFGELELTDDDIWSFSIDAVTGELFTIGFSQTLDVDVPLGYDTSLETNYGVYAEAAKEVAERCNLVGGPVKEVKYGTQGYGGNDPEITMEVYGENGQMAILSFSRYNQRFLGLITDTSRVITDRAMDDLMKEDAEATDWQTETLEDGTVIQWR